MGGGSWIADLGCWIDGAGGVLSVPELHFVIANLLK